MTNMLYNELQAQISQIFTNHWEAEVRPRTIVHMLWA